MNMVHPHDEHHRRLVRMMNFPGVSPRRTSDHFNGADAVAAGAGRTEYAAAMAWPRPFRV
jgi:hypothetical protein